MTIAIIQFPGSNCETETLRAVHNVGMLAEEFLWNRDPNELKKFDGYIIVGGFSYEDRSRSGIIAALDPLIPYLRNETEKGKPLLGICNGAQILVETGLVPGLKNYALCMALAENKRVQNDRVLGTGYYNAWVHMKLSATPQRTAFTLSLKKNEILEIPIAHGEGRFIIPSELLAELKTNQQNIFRYCNASGETTEEFPTNPNGAAYNLAAVSNSAGNILAMMPHPERRPDMGKLIFESMREYIAKKTTTSLNPTLSYVPPIIKPTKYHLPNSAFVICTKLIITDNEAKTVEAALERLGLPVTVDRITHWEISTQTDADQKTTQTSLVNSGELFNQNKEKIIGQTLQKNDDEICFLVRAAEDLIGESKKQSLTERFDLKNITSLKKSSLWKITSRQGAIPNLREKILATNILFNQFSQECFIYSL
jgi:phosphoribosylformylglycinamidine synthase subunit PurQ / glutaminase